MGGIETYANFYRVLCTVLFSRSQITDTSNIKSCTYSKFQLKICIDSRNQLCAWYEETKENKKKSEIAKG